MVYQLGEGPCELSHVLQEWLVGKRSTESKDLNSDHLKKFYALPSLEKHIPVKTTVINHLNFHQEAPRLGDYMSAGTEKHGLNRRAELSKMHHLRGHRVALSWPGAAVSCKHQSSQQPECGCTGLTKGVSQGPKGADCTHRRAEDAHRTPGPGLPDELKGYVHVDIYFLLDFFS